MKKSLLTIAIVLVLLQLTIAQSIKEENQTLSLDKSEMSSEKAFELFNKHNANRKNTGSLIYKQQLDSMITYHWNSTIGQYANGTLHYYTYNHNADCILDIQKQWNYSTLEWENSNKHEITYDANHNKILEIISEKSLNNNSWELSRKLEFAYNASGIIILRSTNVWSTNNNWEKAFKSEYILNSNNLPDSAYYYKKKQNANQWELKSSYEYIYDSNTNLLHQYTYSLNITTNQWEKNYQKDYLYDSNGWLIKDYSGMYFSASSVWDTSMMVVHHNDAMGVDTMSVMYMRFAAYGGTWDPHSKMQKQFDTYNNLTFFLKSNWDSFTSQWEYNEKETRIFNNNYLKTDLVLPLDYYYNTMVLDATNLSWSSSSMSWENNNQRNYYYSPDATSIEESQKSKYSLYPNPSSDYIKIDLGDKKLNYTFKLYDACGKMLKSTVVKSNQAIDIHYLESGVYFYVIEVDQELFEGKFIKQ